MAALGPHRQNRDNPHRVASGRQLFRKNSTLPSGVTGAKSVEYQYFSD
jgi:hypothetical protein